MIFRILLGLIGISAQSYLYYFSAQDHFISIVVPYLIAFIVYLYAIFESIKSLDNCYFWIKMGFLMRFIGLLAFPNLSDDIYRYWWDGHLLTLGINPFEYTPGEILSNLNLPIDTQALSAIYPLLNSPNYYSVYPVIGQIVFWIGAMISGKNILMFSFVLKFILILVDVGIVYFIIRLLRLLNLPLFMSICYFMHPLVLTELNGNVHLESFVVLFTMMAIFYIIKLNYFKSGLSLGVAVMTKLVPLLWVPMFLQSKKLKPNVVFVFGLGLICLSFIPFVYTFYSNLQRSITLYFVQFEFNSSFYSLLEHYFIFTKEYDWQKWTSAILMSFFILISFVIIVKHFIKKEQPGFNFDAAWFLFFSYLIFSSTVHPWYLIPLLFMGIFCYPVTSITWSILCVLSYIKFDASFGSYYSLLKWIEYVGVLCVFIYEFIYYKKIKKDAIQIAPFIA